MRDRQFTTTWIKGLLTLAMGMQLCACGKDAAKDPAEAPRMRLCGTGDPCSGGAVICCATERIKDDQKERS